MDTGRFTRYGEDDMLRAGYDGIVANANAQKADRARRGRATLGSIVGHAMRNGGMVPRELAQSVGMELGQPGFVGGTLTKDGTFMSLWQGKDGSIQPTGLVSAPDVLKAMVDSGNWRDAFQFDKRYMQMYTPEQKKAVTGFSPQWAQEAQSKEDANNKKIVLQGLFDIAKPQKDRPPMTAREAWQRGMSDPKFIEAWMTKPNPDKDLVEVTPRVPLETEEEVAAAMKKFAAAYGKLESGGGKEAMNPFQERILAIADRVLGPAPVDPNATEMRQRAAMRANVIDAADGRQTGFYYRRETPNDPEMVATNGYVVGGKAYDRYGNLMQGVQPLDYQGNPIQGAAASTSAPAQQQSQAARQSDNGDTHTDERGTWQAVRDANGNIIGKKLISKPAAQPEQQQSTPLSQPVTSLETPTPTQPTQQPKEKTPQDHIGLILRDRRLSPKEKEARIAYWRRIQQRNAEKTAAELGVDVNDDLAMLEAELNGPSETMIASN
jgi:hypothetical protein